MHHTLNIPLKTENGKEGFILSIASSTEIGSGIMCLITHHQDDSIRLVASTIICTGLVLNPTSPRHDALLDSIQAATTNVVVKAETTDTLIAGLKTAIEQALYTWHDNNILPETKTLH